LVWMTWLWPNLLGLSRLVQPDTTLLHIGCISPSTRRQTHAARAGIDLSNAAVAGMATNDFARRLERTDRLVGMNDEMDRGMNSVLRHARPTVPAGKSSISESGRNLIFLAFFLIRSPWNSQGLLKIAAFAPSDSGREHDCDALRQAWLGRCGAPEEVRGGRLHGALGQKPTP
jgi:hypothetical protein